MVAETKKQSNRQKISKTKRSYYAKVINSFAYDFKIKKNYNFSFIL